MILNHLLIDMDKLPDCEMKEHVLMFAQKYNALVGETDKLRADMDSIAGGTEEQRKDTADILEKGRKLIHWFHSRRFDAALIGMQMFFVTWVLKFLGVTPEQIQRFMDLLIKVLEKFAGM